MNFNFQSSITTFLPNHILVLKLNKKMLADILHVRVIGTLTGWADFAAAALAYPLLTACVEGAQIIFIHTDYISCLLSTCLRLTRGRVLLIANTCRAAAILFSYLAGRDHVTGHMIVWNSMAAAEKIEAAGISSSWSSRALHKVRVRAFQRYFKSLLLCTYRC